MFVVHLYNFRSIIRFLSEVFKVSRFQGFIINNIQAYVVGIWTETLCFTKADSNNYSNNTHDSNNRNSSNNNNGSNNNINCNKNSGDCNDIVVMIIMHPIILILIISGKTWCHNNLNICCINVLSLYSVFLCVDLNKVIILFISGLFV